MNSCVLPDTHARTQIVGSFKVAPPCNQKDRNRGRNRIALIEHICLPKVAFNLIKLNLISNKIDQNPLNLFFFFIWIYIKLYLLIETNHITMPDFMRKMKWMKVSKSTCNVKGSERKYMDPSLYWMCTKLNGVYSVPRPILHLTPWNSVQYCLCNHADKQ